MSAAETWGFNGNKITYNPNGTNQIGQIEIGYTGKRIIAATGFGTRNGK